MKRRRDAWIERMCAVERKSETIRYALDRVADALARNPSALTQRGLEKQDFQATVSNRESTCLIRLFAVFENELREAWVANGETTHPKTLDLLNAFASRRDIQSELLIPTHRVRMFRHSIAHESSEPSEALSLAECRRFLCRFFSYLPDTW